jgi:hypothetical protein
MSEFEFFHPSWDEPRGGGLPGPPLVEDEAPDDLLEPTLEPTIVAVIGRPVPLPPPQCPLRDECPLYENGL